MPEEAPLEEAGCLGAALVGVSDLIPKSEPTALSKKPLGAGLEEAGCLGAAFVGVAGLVANSEPTTLSKKPLEVPASQALNMYWHRRYMHGNFKILHVSQNAMQCNAMQQKDMQMCTQLYASYLCTHYSYEPSAMQLPFTLWV